MIFSTHDQLLMDPDVQSKTNALKQAAASH